MVEATQGDDRFTRAFATLGSFEAVCEVEADDHADLLDAISVVNDVEAQQASETLLDMAVEEEEQAPAPSFGGGAIRALVLVDESKHRGCHYAHTLFEAALKAHDGIEDAYPLLGRFDDSIWISGDDLGEVTEALRAVQELDGVAASVTLVEAPS